MVSSFFIVVLLSVFGCVPAPSDAVVLLWARTLPVTFTAGLIACAVIAGLRRRGRSGSEQ